MRKLNLNSGKALVVVAHPDDETIWMGGAILKNPSINWTVLSLCRRNDRDRYPKFLRAMDFYKARGIIEDLEDDGVLSLKDSLPEIEKRIFGNLPERKFDCIFTHGSNGEYQHPRHQGVHQVVERLTRGGRLKSSHLFFFAYQLDKSRGVCVPKKTSLTLELSSEEFKTKRSIIKELYGFSKMSFENRSCSRLETFTRGSRLL